MSAKKAFAIIFIFLAFVVGCIGGILNTEAFNIFCISSCLTGLALMFWDYFENNNPPTR